MEKGVEKNPGSNDPSQNPKNYPPCKEGEFVVLYDDDFPQKECECVRKEIEKEVNGAYCKKLTGAGKIELWKSNEIHSEIHIDRVVKKLGTTTTHGDKVTYSLNYTNGLPYDEFKSIDPAHFGLENANFKNNNKSKVIIAVLDTGVNLDLVPKEYLWSTNIEDQNGGRLIYGKNFVKDDDDSNDYDISENNPSLHGTLINAYIIEQFKNSPNNSVQIMNLKTHDEDGRGNLFSTISAIQFAIDHGAHIINASWGFYIDEEMDNKFLHNLKLFEKGIFFITAAGNKIEQADLRFNKLRKKKKLHPLDPRNLNHHYFYPANFSKGLSDEVNNIITVTTIDEVKGCVSPTQNFSAEIVDFGVQADIVESNPEYFLFNFPFKFKDPTSENLHISGSSFATAIASGKIGANLPVDFLNRDLSEGSKGTKQNKKRLLDLLDKSVFAKGGGKLKDQIKEGRYMFKMDSGQEKNEYKSNI